MAQLSIIISDEAKEKLEKIAKKEKRSMSKQIEWWIENYKLKEKE